MKMPRTSTPDLVFGSAFHNTAEDYLVNGGSPLGIWEKHWNAAINDDRIFWGLDNPDDYKELGEKIFSSYDILRQLDAISIMYDNEGPIVERKVEITIPNVPVPIIGYIDLIMKDGVPGDFKTSKRKWNYERAKAEMQPLFYLVAMQQLGILSVADEWKFRHIVVVKNKTPYMEIIEHTRKPQEIDFLYSYVQNVWDGIACGAFPENPNSWLCNPKFCDFWQICRGRYV